MFREKKNQHSIAYDVSNCVISERLKNLEGVGGEAVHSCWEVAKRMMTLLSIEMIKMLCKYKDELECTEPWKQVNTIFLRDFK